MMRNTRQRQTIVRLLQHTECHPDAAWLHARGRAELPSLSLGTVYRILDALVREGTVTTIERAGEATRYDYQGEGAHGHAVCQSCGEVFDIDLPVSAIPAQTLPPGFSGSSLRFEVRGVCGRCAEVGGEPWAMAPEEKGQAARRA